MIESLSIFLKWCGCGIICCYCALVFFYGIWMVVYKIPLSIYCLKTGKKEKYYCHYENMGDYHGYREMP